MVEATSLLSTDGVTGNRISTDCERLRAPMIALEIRKAGVGSKRLWAL